ncbi:TadE/TadG family type IV pilus assembly protein [Hirschia litorea]|uniref:Pilus assembly protein TadG-related protein n=1 Tax=Hirschia litorea TaxID=1199156 RepID=A0ABW2IMF2_9PROT
MQLIRREIRKFCKNTAGGIAPMFAVVFLATMFIVGFTVDFRRMQTAGSHLQAATDSSVLAAARAYILSTSEKDVAKRQAAASKVAKDYLQANLASFNADFKNTDIKLAFNADGEITADSKGDLTLIFGGLMGKNKNTIPAHAAATIGDSRKLEIVLVLDNSGSMTTSNRMKQLRKASISFVNSVFDNAVHPNSVQIGVVPWNATVNINVERPLSWDPSPGPAANNSNYGDGAKSGVPLQDFTNHLFPPKFNDYSTYRNSDIKNDFGSDGWMGCIMATKDERKITSSGSISVLTDVPPSKMKWPARKVSGWDPNYHCPSEMLPMSQSRPQVIKKLNQLNPGGNTHADIGLMWGFRMFSNKANWVGFFGYNNALKPDDFGSLQTRKIMIMLTDGENTTSNSEGYSYYGWCTYTKHYKYNRWGYRYHSHTTKDCERPEGIEKEELSGSDLDGLMIDACKAIRKEEVELYTIALDLHSYYNADAISLLKDCAGKESRAYNITGDELDKTFQELASKALRLSE